MNRYIFLFITALVLFFWGYTSNNVSVNSKMDLGDEWNQALREHKPILVYIYVDWCHTCQQIGPIVDSLAGEYSGIITYIKANAEDEQSYALSKAFKVRGYPTIYLFNPENNKTFNVPLYADSDALRTEFNNFLK